MIVTGAVALIRNLDEHVLVTLRKQPFRRVPRAYHTATLLRDSRVLMAGGTTANFASAQLYIPSVLVPDQVVAGLGFDRTSVVSGTSYSVNLSGANITAQTFFDVRFIAPGSTWTAWTKFQTHLRPRVE